MIEMKIKIKEEFEGSTFSKIDVFIESEEKRLRIMKSEY